MGDISISAKGGQFYLRTTDARKVARQNILERVGTPTVNMVQRRLLGGAW